MLFFLDCYEMRGAIIKMKLGKATGPSSIPVELLEALQVYGIDMNVKITTLLNKIYGTRQIPPDIPKSIFIALPRETMENRV